MTLSLRRQKILFERELQRLVNNGMYYKNDVGNYRLREPFPSDYFTLRDLRIRERKETDALKRKRNEEFEHRLQKTVDYFTKSSKINKEFSSNFWPENSPFEPDYI